MLSEHYLELIPTFLGSLWFFLLFLTYAELTLGEDIESQTENDRQPETSQLAECRGLQRRVLVQIGLQSDAIQVGGNSHLPTCKALWLAHGEISDPDVKEVATTHFDYVFTDSLLTVPFNSRLGKLHFLENVGEIYVPPEPDEAFMLKEHLLSVLLPADNSLAWEQPYLQKIREEAYATMPEHTFIDDGALTTHVRAFARYRFTLIADDENHTVSQAFVRCIGLQTIPLFNGFQALGVMIMRGVLPFNRTHFNLELLRATLPDINSEIGHLWQYHRMLQDQLVYRYSRPFEERLVSAACTLCRLEHGATEGRKESMVSHSPTVFVGVYSAKLNFDKRAAVRSTWGRFLQHAYHVRFKFFLGELSAKPFDADERVRKEIEKYDDIVILDIAEGYVMNSKKGLLFLEWCAKHSSAEFLLKVDDDVYFRPAPVLEVLRRRPPFGLVWGYFDYMSPVPLTPEEAFYNDRESYPFPTFPPYPRGLVRALSMDVVRSVAEASKRGSLKMIFGDDPCIGVHLRQLVFDNEDPIPLIALDDRDSYRSFAMEPSCLPHLWSHMTPRTWVTHHITADQLYCMWEKDIASGYYELRQDGLVGLSEQGLVTSKLASTVATAKLGEVPDVPPLPDVCDCLLTGPLAEALASRVDKINASRTFEMWGDPSADL